MNKSSTFNAKVRKANIIGLDLCILRAKLGIFRETLANWIGVPVVLIENAENKGNVRVSQTIASAIYESDKLAEEAEEYVRNKKEILDAAKKRVR